jgi:hypothetical protein
VGGSDRDERRRPQGSPEKERPSRSVTSRSGAGDLAIEAVSRPGAATLRFEGGQRPHDRGHDDLAIEAASRPGAATLRFEGWGHDLTVGGQRAHRQQCSFTNAALVDQCAGSTLTMWKPGTSMSVSRILV